MGDIEAGHIDRRISDAEKRTSPILTTLESMSAGGCCSENAVNTDKWASSLERMLDEVPYYMCRPVHPGRITRIPTNLREIDIKSYEPYYLSIGPFHHGKPSLQRMEKKKWVVLKCFLEQRPDLRLKDMLKEIKSIEQQARSFYSDVEMESKKFVEMLLLDSLYLVIVFCGTAETSQHTVNHTKTIKWSSMYGDKNEEVDRLNDGTGTPDDNENTIGREDDSENETSEENYRSGSRWFWIFFTHDLFLLENQLPFFVLQKMHNLVYGGSEAQLLAIIKKIFSYLLIDYVKIDLERIISPTEDVHHLLHLCHMFFRPTIKRDLGTCQLGESSQFRLGSALQLYEAGVIFEAKLCSTQHSLLDITFNSCGKMIIPCLHVDDNTNSLLRNLIALEQMKYPTLGLDVSAYAVLLLHLITIPEDVKLLRRKGIIQHHLSSDKEMMLLVNRLSVGLSFDYLEDSYNLKPVFQELKRYSDHRVPRWRAGFKHKYFNNPWTTISLMAASLLLILTLVQTYYSVYSYYHPFFDGRL